jgi:hypothetical protein
VLLPKYEGGFDGSVCSMNGEKDNAHRILVGMSEGKRPLGRSCRRCLNSIKLDLREIVWGGMDWIDLSQDMDQWRALIMNRRAPNNVWKFSSNFTTSSFSRRDQHHGFR